MGAAIFFELLGAGRIQPIENGVFQETHLGYIISGQVPNTTQKSDISSMSFPAYINCNNMHKLEEKMLKLWRSEEIFSEKSYLLGEKLCQRHFDRTVKRNKNGRFTVCLPFRDFVINLAESKNISLRRFLALEQR